MDKAKAAITDFMGRSGHHDTTVHEAVAPAVQHEVIKPHVHEEINTAIDKEVHQDHYHRTVQPVHDREVLPEQHTAKLGAVQHREFDHRDADATKRALIDDQARFADERRIEDTTHSQSVAPTVGGEHVHHHIHETIQPVVQKETIQPNVVHTTVPIHEVHHNKATHHETTALPAMTMEQFKAKGGALTGREERYDEFEGVPKNIGGAGGIGAAAGLAHKTTSHGHEHARHGDYDATPNHHSDAGLREGGLTHNSTTTGTHNPLDRNNDGKVGASDLTGSHSNTTHGTTGLGSSTTHGTTGLGSSTTHGTSNPLDRNNDGRVGAGDLTGSHSTTHGSTGLGSSTTHGTTGLGSSTTHGTTGLGSSNTGAYGSTSHNDPTGPHGSHMMNKADPRVDSDRLGTAGNTAGAGGYGAGQYTEGTHGTHGTTGSGLTGHSTTGTGLGHTGGHGTADFNDHNNSGLHNTRIANQVDPHVGGVGSTGTGAYNTTGSGLTGHNTAGSGLTGHGTTGTHNPLDRNNDGRVGAGDLTGSHSNTHTAGGIGSTGGLGHSNTTHTGTSNPLDRNNDGRVGASDLTGSHSNTGAYGSNAGGIGSGGLGHGGNTHTTGEHTKTVPGEVGGSGRDNLAHRNNETGDLPKALVEPVSVAEPHSSLQNDQHHSGHGTHGTHGTTDVHGKPSMMDKLNPKKDADHDGKAGIMD